MSHEDVIYLSMTVDDDAYQRWFKSTPEYWSELCSELTANTISPGEERDSYSVSGVVIPARKT